jgi:hypothetical protein
MVFEMPPDPQTTTVVANRTIVHVAENTAFIELGLIEPTAILQWFAEVNAGRTPPVLRARHNARVVTNLAALMSLRAQLNDLAKRMGIVDQPLHEPPTTTTPN